MAQKWNLQDIRPVNPQPAQKQRPRQDIAPRRESAATPVKRDPDLDAIAIIDGRKRRRKRIFISIFVALIILGAGFAVNVLLSGAEVTVYPKYRDTTVQAVFTAYREPEAGELGYEMLTLEASGERQVSATGQEEASERAEGTVFIYNEFSESPQRLIKNTRFESPDGLIFRINESVEVPGMAVQDDGTIVPGIISATVFADGPGEQYNIAPARFSIPGLRGSEQYEKMYAESTDSFAGGFEGTRFIIDDGELETAKQSLHLELRDALLARLESEAPAGFVLYNDAVTFVYESLPATEYGDELATIKERATLQVPILKEDQFAEYLAQNTIAGYEGELVSIEDPYTLTFSYASATAGLGNISELESLDFKLSGNTRIIWIFDDVKLRSDLAGLSKTALPTVLSGYPAIERAEAVVRPFWSQSFPTEPEEIALTVQLAAGAK